MLIKIEYHALKVFDDFTVYVFGYKNDKEKAYEPMLKKYFQLIKLILRTLLTFSRISTKI